MNKDNLRTLIDVLKKSKTFNMSYYRECGTPACIAGHIQAISNRRDHFAYNKLTQDFLGVSSEQAQDIIAPTFDYAHYSQRFICDGHITKAHAIRMLEGLLETGEVDWKSSKEESKAKEHEKFDMEGWLKKIELEVEVNKAPLNA